MVMRWEEMIPGALFLGWGILWVIMITAFWLLVLLGLALAVRWLWRAGSGIKIPAPQGESALEVLKKRYAKGEIEKEEYETKKRDLM
jgi:putative membrane protein